MNALEQRTSVATAGEAFEAAPADWQWSYDALGQVIQANTDGYSYDQIGNRLQTKKNSQVADTYTANALNQYTEITGTPAQYDADGNLVSGLQSTEAQPDRSQLTFTYNAHNRPISVPKGSTDTETYTYDHQGRRIRKGNTVTLYDGYNAIAEYSATTPATLQTTYAWGLDLMAGLTQSGGVGALVSTTDHTTQTPLTSYPAYDGNGNITEYLTAANNGTLTAHYEYDAFGNVEKKTGTKEYCYQFSTKPFDTTTGLNYYNYRTYDPQTGRWINRDPIGEEGGVNLYLITTNNLISKFDYLGNSDGSDSAGECCYNAKQAGLDKGHSGGVICCKGEKIGCNWQYSENWNDDEMMETILMECITEHELGHFDDVIECDCERKDTYRPKFNAEAQKKWREIERRQHMQEAKCIESLRYKCENSYDPKACNDRIDRRLNDIQNYLDTL